MRPSNDDGERQRIRAASEHSGCRVFTGYAISVLEVRLDGAPFVANQPKKSQQTFQGDMGTAV